MSSSPAFKHFSKAQTEFKIPLLFNENGYLGDIVSSEDVNFTAPMSAGFYRLEAGTPLEYTYTFDEMKIILDGEFTIEDETGQKVKATKGDVFFFPKDSRIRFTTEKGGLAFFTGQRKQI